MYTKGPWLLQEKTVYALNAEGFNRFSAQVQDAHTNSEELVANARIMSVAPELLEALMYARRFLKKQDHDTDYIDAVIAKAKGENQ